MNSKIWKVLLLDDDEEDYIILREMLEEIRYRMYRLVWVSTISEAIEKIRSDAWDAVLVDFDLGVENGLSFIRTALESGFRHPLIMITGRGSYELDVQAMQAGATDYLSKTMLNPPLLERVIRYAIEHTNSETHLDEIVKERTEQLENALEELRVTEEELRHQNENIRAALKKTLAENNARREQETYITTGHLVTSTAGVILRADQGASLLLNVPPDALVERLLISFISNGDRAQFGREIVSICQAETPHNLRVNIQPARKEPVSACLTGVCRPQSSGGVTQGNSRSETPVIHWLVHAL